MSEKKIISIERAPKEFFDKLKDYCVGCMEDYLEHVLDMCRSNDDYRPYKQITGMTPQEAESQEKPSHEIYPGEILVGELEGFDDDYAPLMGRCTEETGEQVPLLDPASYRLTIDIPDLVDLDNKEHHVRDLLEEKVVNELILNNLKNRQRSGHLDYFDLLATGFDRKADDGSTLMPLEEHRFKESKREELQPTIDRFVDKLYKAIVKTEIERQHGKVAAGLDEKDLEMDYHTGARIKLDCSVNLDGDLDVRSADRRYLESVRQRFTIPIPYVKGLPNLDEFMRVALFEGLEVGAVNTNLILTDHPEYHKMFQTDDNGNLRATERCKKLFARWRRDLTKQLLSEVMKLNVGEEGQVLVEGHVDETGIHKPKVEFRRMEYVRSNLPNTEGMSEDDRLDAYDYAAQDITLNLIKANLPHIEDAGFDKNRTLVALQYLVSQGNTEDADVLTKAAESGELNMPVVDAARIERLYNHVLDKVTNQMAHLHEDRAYPFYVGLIAWGTEQDEKGRPLREGQTGLPLISMDPARKVYLNPKRDPGTNHIILNIPAAPDGKLTQETMRAAAGEMLDKVISRIIRQHMQSSDGQEEHLYFPQCFMQNPENPSQHMLTDKGASELERTIKDLLKQTAITSIQTRAIAKEQLAGHRFRMGYRVTDSDSFYVKPQSIGVEVFVDQKNAAKIPIAAPSMTPADILETVVRRGNIDIYFALKDMPPENSELVMQEYNERYREELKDLAKGLVLTIMAQNMQGTSHIPSQVRQANRIPDIPAHPAYESYFTKDESGRYSLTETGKKVIGKLAENYTEQIAARLEKETDGQNPFLADFRYAFGTHGLKGFTLKAAPIRQSMYDLFTGQSRSRSQH